MWVATLRGVFSRPLGNYSAAWTPRLQPNPSYLPGGANAGVQNSADMNIANDIQVDPKNQQHLLAALGWRNGAAYNGLYESTDGGTHWTRINPTGGLDATDIGYVNFAYSTDGKKLYLINQSPKRLNKPGFQNTLLDGVYESDKGLAGPWNKIGSSDKLGSQGSGSALGGNQGKGYSPGVQSWYNQSIAVDPANGNHVLVGLEEVYETERRLELDDGRPVLELLLQVLGARLVVSAERWAEPLPARAAHRPALDDDRKGRRRADAVHRQRRRRLQPSARRSHQHQRQRRRLEVAERRHDGRAAVLLRRRRQAGRQRLAPRPRLRRSSLVSGGLQDNGGSLLRPGAAKMVSNFGGDGGDVLVDPNNGCNIVQEYVYLTMEVTQTCANPGPASERVPRPERRDDVQHRAAGRQRAVHRALHGERQEHQPVDRGRYQPLVPGQGLRDPEPGRVAEDLLAALAGADVHGGRLLG